MSLRLTAPPPPKPGPKPPVPEDVALVWDATLTVDVSANGLDFGCYNNRSGSDPCTRNRALDSPKFTFKGTAYKVQVVEWTASTGTLSLAFDGIDSGSDVKAALAGTTLHADGRAFAVRDSTASTGGLVYWTGADLGWVYGQQVTLYLTAPPPPERVTEPEGRWR